MMLYEQNTKWILVCNQGGQPVASTYDTFQEAKEAAISLGLPFNFENGIQ